RSDRAALAGQLNLALARFQEPAQHFDRRRLPGSVRAEEPVDFAVLDLETDVVDGGKRAKLFHQVLCADGCLATQMRVVVPPRKRNRVWFLAQIPECRDEGVLERRVVNANLVKRNLSVAQLFLDDALSFVRVACEQIEPVAKTL